MGEVHVRAWQATYRGLMPDDYLDGLVPADRAPMWASAIEQPRPGQILLVVESDGSVLGFAAAGPEGGQSGPTGSGELYAINLDPGSWGRGLGRTLLRAVETSLLNAGFTDAVLWVHPANQRAIAFYRAAGWVSEGIEREADVLGVQVPEARFRRRLEVGNPQR